MGKATTTIPSTRPTNQVLPYQSNYTNHRSLFHHFISPPGDRDKPPSRPRPAPPGVASDLLLPFPCTRPRAAATSSQLHCAPLPRAYISPIPIALPAPAAARPLHFSARHDLIPAGSSRRRLGLPDLLPSLRRPPRVSGSRLGGCPEWRCSAPSRPGRCARAGSHALLSSPSSLRFASLASVRRSGPASRAAWFLASLCLALHVLRLVRGVTTAGGFGE